MKHKTELRAFLLIYAVLTAGVFLVGVTQHSMFYILLSPVVMLVGFSIINSIKVRHIQKILKKNNLWDEG